MDGSIERTAECTPILPVPEWSGPLAACLANRGALEFTGHYHASIAEISEPVWNRLFAGLSENWSYFQALERTRSAFSYGAITVTDGIRILAAAPLFRIGYRLDTALSQSVKGWTERIARTWPDALHVPLIGLGSPMSEECILAFAPELAPAEREAALHVLLETLDEAAAKTGARVLALKDLPERDAGWMHPALARAGYARMASLPIGTLGLDYESEEGYLASLPPKVRTDLRRKMRLAKAVEVEFHDTIEDTHEEIVNLYQQTRATRKVSYDGFDSVPDGYFREIMASNASARIMLCRVDGKIASFNFFLEERDRVIGKFIGMDYGVSRQHNLYFVNWMLMVRYCIRRGIPNLQTGQTTYLLKSRLGCRLKRSWIYVRHRNSIVNAIVRLAAPSMGLDRNDPDLAALGGQANYVAE